MNELVGKYYDASQLIDYKADVEQQLLIIYLSGYLTIKDFNERLYTFKMFFPNEEVRNGFIDAVASGFFKGRQYPHGMDHQCCHLIGERHDRRIQGLRDLMSIPIVRKKVSKRLSMSSRFSKHLVIRVIDLRWGDRR